MRPILLYGVFGILILGTLVLLLSAGMSPKIYQRTDDPASTLFHSNIEVIREISVNSSTDILPVMQDLLDLSGTIAVTIRKSDLETAGTELAKYSKRHQDLSNLVLKLDMSESEVADFSRNAKIQDDLLRQFMNTSASLQSLKTLEIQYREDNDPTSLTTVQLQGKALEEKIRALNTRYAEVNDALSHQGASTGLDTSLADQSRGEINNFTRSVVSDQKQRETSQKVEEIRGLILSVLVEPDRGAYRDTITVFGYLTGGNVTGRKVVVLLDTSSILELITDETGSFRTPYEIGNISTGDHTLVAVSGPAQSAPQPLTVTGSNTTLSLTIKAVKNRAEVNLAGLLSARLPVKNAPVQILVNNDTWKSTVTGGTGRYLTNLSLPAGTFQVSTRFEDPTFPLNVSQSFTYEVVSSGSSITTIRRTQAARPQPVWIIPVLVICLLAGCTWYMRRKGIIFRKVNKQEETGAPWYQSIEASNTDHSSGTGQESPVLSEESTGNSAGGRISSTSETAYIFYIRLVNRLAEDLHTRKVRTLTAREVAARSGFHPQAERIRIFIGWYERIRYGGYEGEEDIAAFESSIADINVELGSDLREE